LTILPDGFTARPATLDDVEAFTEVVNRCAVARVGKPFTAVEEMRTDWQSPVFNPETHTRLVYAADGTLAAVAEVWQEAPYVSLFGWVEVTPEYGGRGLGAYLGAWVEERSLEVIPKAPSEARVSVQQEAVSTDDAMRAALLAQGYQLVRHSLYLRIDQTTPPPEPQLPTGIVIRPFLSGEERTFIGVIRECFKDHWGYVDNPFEEYYEQWMHFMHTDPHIDPALWFVAMEGDEMVGTSFCSLEMAEEPDLGWVFALGVRRPWRKRGLGEALLRHCFGALYRRGKPNIGLRADAQNLTGAMRLYRKVGMRIERQYDIYEKELRAGVDMSTQTISE